MSEFHLEIRLEVVACATCGLKFAFDKALVARRSRDHENFFCPNGHLNYFPPRAETVIESEVVKTTDGRSRMPLLAQDRK
jgi:hypothetical protein